MNQKEITPSEIPNLIQDLKQLIESTRGRVASSVNSATTLMYWHIGERINREVLGNERASYGKQIVTKISVHLQADYGEKGFDEKSIRRMMQFAQKFPSKEIVAQVARHCFNWTLRA